MIQIKGHTISLLHDAYFFGYGSLVNRDTHVFDAAHPAQLSGWRRVWRHTELRPVAFLTVIPDPASTIDGLIAAVPGADWSALDLREAAYARVPAQHQVSHALNHRPDIAVYSIPEGAHGSPSIAHPILLSYLDVVVQGYLREFGTEGVARFFDSTHGWDAPILDDRAKPRYPRYQSLSAKERALSDENLARVNARMIPDSD